MDYGAPAKKDRRRKAMAVLTGQVDLTGKTIEAPRLPLKIPKGVHTLFLGLGPALNSARTGHYYPGKSNYFWKLLYRSGIWPEEITAEEDDKILEDGFGLADVTRRPTSGIVLPTKAEFMAARDRVRSLAREWSPQLIVFVGLRAYRTYLRNDKANPEYGEQNERVGGARVFVIPSTSGASVGDTPYAEKLDWFKRLNAVIREVRGQE